VINDDIHIVVIEIRDDSVRLEVETPEGVFVHRGEVFDALGGPKWKKGSVGDNFGSGVE